MKSKRIFGAAVLCTIVGLLAWRVAVATDDIPDCYPVDGWGETVATMPAPGCVGTFVGGGAVALAGVEYTVDITTCQLQNATPGDDGTLQAPTSHTIDFYYDTDGDGFEDYVGSITTADKAVLEFLAPPALFRLNSNMTVISGAPAFEEAVGRLHAHGEIDLALGIATFDLRGVVCPGQRAQLRATMIR